MGSIKAILGIAIVAAVVLGGSQIFPPELANYQFQDDLRNLAMMAGSAPNKSDEDVRNDVIKKAKDHDIQLDPKAVTVTHIGTPGAPAVYLAADYRIPVNLPGYSFDLHFTPSSENRGF
jgi:hypothetical protein